MRPERHFKLFDGDARSFDEVRATLVRFLEDFRSSAVGEQAILNIDVSDTPLYTDFRQLQEVGTILCDFEDCFQKVCLLRIISAPGIQEQLIRGIFLFLPFPVPVEVAMCSDVSPELSGSQVAS